VPMCVASARISSSWRAHCSAVRPAIEGSAFPAS
jgi:hypothetical protein